MRSLLLATLTLFAIAIASTLTATDERAPVIPGLSRNGLDPRTRGLILLGELGCANCHAPGPYGELVSTRKAPDLHSVGARVHPDDLKAFIARPRRVKPGTAMPDLLGRRDERQRTADADALTHYLVSLGSERFSPQAPDRVAAARGRELFHSIGCVACHSPRDADGHELSKDDSAPLGRLERKYSVAGLAAFLEMPHRTRPSGRMPDFNLPPGEAYQVANYLLSDTRVPGSLRYTLYLDDMKEGPDRLEGKEQRAGLARGFNLGGFETYREDFALRFEGYLEIAYPGEYTFSLECNHVGRLRISGRSLISLERPGRQEATVRLSSGLHAIELVYLHVRGEPRLDLRLSGPGMETAPLPASMLRSEKAPAESYEPFVVDADRAETGKALFAEFGCGRCHPVEAETPAEVASKLTGGPELSKTDPAKGCLSGKAGTRVSYGLTARQIHDIRAALCAPDFVLTPEHEIRKTLATFNCIACHERGDWGGIPASRNDFYLSDDPNLGETGRIPPPLTGVGAKLQSDWLRKAMAKGQALRSYMSMRMPGFGNENVGHLAELFARQDRVPAVTFEPLPRDGKKARAIRDMGRQLVGDKGLSCITCHTFAGRKAGTMAAIDLVETTTQRLRKDWFYHYILQPARYRPITIMPQFFPDGVSIVKDIADGDPRRQLGAIWHYLSDGRNAGPPRGMRRPPMEIVVGDEAVMLRRSAQDTGKRAISVGYPLGVNLIFDAESVSLHQIWRGKFIDPAGVWTGQGSGRVRILSRDRVRLVKGPAFAELAHEAAPWPTEMSRALGFRFRGYELDEVRRPTFFYTYGDIAITDKVIDRPDERVGGGWLERRLTLRSSEDRTLYFRAAVHAELEVAAGRAIAIGQRATVRASVASGDAESPEPLAFRIRPSAGDSEGEKEAIVPVEMRSGKATLVLEYRWMEAPE